MLHYNDGGIFLFPPLLWKFQYDFDIERLYPKISDILTMVEINSQLEKGQAISTVSLADYLQPHTWQELQHFQFWLGEKISYVRKQLSFHEEHSEVVNSWVNRHNNTGMTTEHAHANTTFVVSAYIKCPKGSGNIEFKDPLEYHKHCFPTVSDDIHYRAVPCATNDVLIFPGWLRHRTEPSTVNDERIVITFNIK